MAHLSRGEMARLLEPYLADPDERLVDDLAVYLELLLKWNERTNLTAIRDPAGIVARHFGESLLAGRYVGEPATLLDFGSGAGFPGIPIALLRPEIRVTLAECQGKKSAFLREAVRVLGIPAEIWAGRAEAMAAGTRFDCVTLRAVDDMALATRTAADLAAETLVVLSGRDLIPETGGWPGFALGVEVSIPGGGTLLRYDRVS